MLKPQGSEKPGEDARRIVEERACSHVKVGLFD